MIIYCSKLTNFDANYHTIIMNKLFAFLLIGTFLTSCSSDPNLLEDASWLTGNWKREYNEVAQIEKWQVTETGFTGQNMVVMPDTTLMYTLDIRRAEKYWELTKHEAEIDLDYSYVLISSSNSDSIVFRNKENIWPQIITYKKIDTETMEIIVDGQDGTMQKNVAFIFTRF